MLRIEAIAEEPLVEVRYLNAERQNRGTTVARLPIVTGTIVGLAGELDAIVCCSDLQGIVRGADAQSELLGIAVADQLAELAYDKAIPPVARTGVVLAGDLYSVPAANKRGGYGKVADVWRAFADHFAWVAGVAGNHDDVSGVLGLADHVHLLDGDRVTVDALVLGGVGGIIGDKAKPGRRPEISQLALVDRAIGDYVDLLILHEGPHGNDHQRGNAAIRTTVEAGGVPLVVCGHSHWHDPLAVYEFGQFLNVDTRVVVLTRA
jgi:hypothetical protein